MKLATMLLLLAASHVFALHTQAHQFSTAYLDVSERDGQPLIVWQAALHDLAQAGLLQGASGNAVSWQQVLNSESQLTAYLSARFLFTADAAPCTLTPLHSANWSLQQLRANFTCNWRWLLTVRHSSTGNYTTVRCLILSIATKRCCSGA